MMFSTHLYKHIRRMMFSLIKSLKESLFLTGRSSGGFSTFGRRHPFAEGIFGLVTFWVLHEGIIRGLGYVSWLSSLGCMYPFWHKPCVVT